MRIKEKSNHKKSDKEIPKKYVIKDDKLKGVYWPSAEMWRMAWVNHASIYEKADKNPESFWQELARDGLTWFKLWDKVYEVKFPYFKWFPGGKINACYNALDRHLIENENAEKLALIWIPEPIKEEPIKLTYKELAKEVIKISNVLKNLGVKKGDVVSIYLPMIPEILISMLACARIGAIHSVVFSAFSAESLKTRIIDGNVKILITADGYYRKGKIINLKEKADEVIKVKGVKIKKVILVRRLKNILKIRKEKKYLFWDEEVKKVKGFVKPQEMNSEDPLFILYTSGTTGMPKGIIHDTGGYSVQAYYTAKWNFNLHENDIMWCTADIGWITGHTYACYGPLMNNITTLIYEGHPFYPNPGRMWQIIEKNKVNVFYTAPTTLRMFALAGKKWPRKYNLNSLKILGTVGECIDEDTWQWYFDNIGKKRCPLIDTWWQTETGGTLINALPGIGPFKPTYVGRSFPGTRHRVVDKNGKEVSRGKHGYLIQIPPFAPGMLHGIWKNKEAYIENYLSQFPGNYFTGDGAFQDSEGNFRITGRVDDVMKVAGHRIATAEMENIIDNHKAIAETAVVSKPDALKGELPVAFVVLENNYKADKNLKKEIIKLVEKGIGPIARPSEIYFVSELPKTRSGKIMRRILKTLLKREKLGDLSTLMNSDCVSEIKNIIK